MFGEREMGRDGMVTDEVFDSLQVDCEERYRRKSQGTSPAHVV